jgi:D-3-phosphoglycerate dehydrogenase
MPSISAEDAPRLKPYMKLAEQLGSFTGQTTDNAIKSVSIEYEGTVAEINTKPLTSMLLSTLLATQLETVNMVNVKSIAESRGISFSETKKGSSEDWRSVITVKIETEKRARSVSGTLFTGKEPRIVDIEGVRIEAGLSNHMLFIRNEDKPGLIGQVGGILGEAGQNIANFHLGRTPKGDSAICLVSLDQELPDDVMEKIRGLGQVTQAKKLAF